MSTACTEIAMKGKCDVPIWCNDQHACHWTQGSRAQTRPRQCTFNGDKKLQQAFLRRK
jgi:hypothetical protein